MRWFDLPEDISRRDAKLILKFMRMILKRYGFVTLADFHDLMGSKVVVYADNKKGWHRLTRSRVSLIRRERRYRIKLPELMDIS